MFEKRGLSPVIAVVLLLMITVVAAGLIVAFVVPFVSKNLDTSGECFDVLGDLSFDETPYNCFAESGGNSRTGFSVRVDNENIIGFRVALQTGGSSDAVEIEEGTNGSSLTRRIRMLSQDFNVPLTVPGRGGVRTYVSEGRYDKAEIFPILTSGGKCDMADDIILKPCEGIGVNSSLLEY